MLAATELGSGFRIAMKDLEIRGAGNILGAQQSGHIHAVGFDLYTKLLGEAVEELRGRHTITEAGTTIEPQRNHDFSDSCEKEAPIVDLGIPANIPPNYIADLPTRLSLYQKISGLEIHDDVTSINEELADRFGPLPWQTHNLLYITRLKISAAIAGVKSIRRNGDRIDITLLYEVAGARVALKRTLDNRVDIGHSQLRMDASKFHEGWESPLEDTVSNIGIFKEKITKQILISGSKVSTETEG
jgi:transcription-repair coupling factor (superfamily II helicase)